MIQDGAEASLDAVSFPAGANTDAKQHPVSCTVDGSADEPNPVDPLAYIGIVASIAEVVTALCADRIKAMRDPGLDARALGELADVSVSFAWLSLYVVTQFQPTPPFLHQLRFVSFINLSVCFDSKFFCVSTNNKRATASCFCATLHLTTCSVHYRKFLYSLVFLGPHCSLAGLLVGF